MMINIIFPQDPDHPPGSHVSNPLSKTPCKAALSFQIVLELRDRLSAFHINIEGHKAELVDFQFEYQEGLDQLHVRELTFKFLL